VRDGEIRPVAKTAMPGRPAVSLQYHLQSR